MKNTLPFLLSLALAATGAAAETTGEPELLPGETPEDRARNISLKLEIERSIERGVGFLEAIQSEDGSWGNMPLPALTALPAHAILGDPRFRRGEGVEVPDSARKALDLVLSHQQESGGIYTRGLASYNTSIAIMALLAADDPAYHDAIRTARAFLVQQQNWIGEPGDTSDPVSGGIGYGNSLPHSDLSNTHLALEALYHSRVLVEDEGPDTPDLDWDAALTFISRTQNLPETNDQPWASDIESERGGFIYTPVESKAGEFTLPGGGTGLRSYGSMTYSGLLSLIYADVDSDDPRVIAAKEWLERHYSLDENPRLGYQGLFYYFHTMAKALTAAGVRELNTADGRSVDWKQELALRLFDLQRTDGSWVNEGSARWMEDDGSLVTAYALLTLQHIYYNL